MIPTLLAGGHRAAIDALAFSPDGSRFVAGDSKGWLVVRELDGSELARVRVPPAGPYSPPRVRAAVWPSADVIVTQEYGAVHARRASDLGEIAATTPLGSGPLVCASRGAWVVVLSNSGATVHDVPTLTRRVAFPVWRGDYEYFQTRLLAADPLGSLVFVADDGGSDETAMGATIRSGEPQVNVFDAALDRTLPPVAAGDHLNTMCFDPWRRCLVTASFGGDVTLWTGEGEVAGRFRPYPTTYVRTLEVTERWLVMVPNMSLGAAVVDLWDASTLEKVASSPVPGGLAPSPIAASPDGRTLLHPALPSGGLFSISRWTIDR